MAGSGTDGPPRATGGPASPGSGGVLTASDDVAARYARPPRRVSRTLLVVAGVLALLVSFASVTTAVLSDQVRWRDVGFDVVSPERVLVTFEVYADAGDRVRCQVRAADTRYGDVGQVEVDLGPLPARGQLQTVEVRTVAPAVSASVRTCVRLP